MSWIRILVFTLLIALSSCNQVERVESSYNTIEEASSDQFLEQGWIPEEAIYPSMTNIYNQSYLDANTNIFSFQLEPEDLADLQTKLQATEAFIEMPYGIKQPKEWVDVLVNSQNYVLQSGDQTIFIALENDGNTVLGWRN